MRFVMDSYTDDDRCLLENLSISVYDTALTTLIGFADPERSAIK